MRRERGSECTQGGGELSCPQILLFQVSATNSSGDRRMKFDKEIRSWDSLEAENSPRESPCENHHRVRSSYSLILEDIYHVVGLPGWLSCEEPTCQYRRHERRRFDPWVGKIPWRKVWQPTPVLLPRESHGQRSQAVYGPSSHKESDMTKATSHGPFLPIGAGLASR